MFGGADEEFGEEEGEEGIYGVDGYNEEDQPDAQSDKQSEDGSYMTDFSNLSRKEVAPGPFPRILDRDFMVWISMVFHIIDDSDVGVAK